MNRTAKMIEELSHQAPLRPMPHPSYWAWRLVAVLVLYGVASAAYLGFRPDIALQLARPLFAIEIALLAGLAGTSMLAALLTMYPDGYQQPFLLKLPYVFFGLLSAMIIFQLFMPPDVRMQLPENVHGMECALCIAALTFIPSAILFSIVRIGATVHPLQSGIFVVMAASAIGGLMLRLAEQNDAMLHLFSWHYLPTVLFASLGAVMGKYLLKW